ncbi:U-box domain-containing protein 35 isoform X2 [Zea mays]|uniref:U-box domain-containing protein 35 isoform X2 n=1 Tax=Zea mays TaxID=4577 RepID=UPI0004DE9249|nr:U-box domain-containing protein 35 isoform X2 [Zea mays]
MATQEETMVTESSPSSDSSITIGLAVSSSKSSKYAVNWALKNFGTRQRIRFMLIHVRQKVTLVPTPMGNYVPVDQVRDDIASAYEKEVECEAQNMLLMYKNMCDGKVEAEVLVVKGDDVAETISGVVLACQIHKLFVGVSSHSNFISSRALGCSLEYASVFQAFVWCMLFQKVGCPWFILLDQKVTTVLRYSRSTRVLTVNFIQISHQYQASAPCATGQISASTNLPLSDKALTVKSALQELMLSEDKASTHCASGQISGSSNFPISYKAPTVSNALQELMLSEDKDNANFELEKLRIKLEHMKGVCKLVQDESTSASQQMIDLVERRAQEEARLAEVRQRINITTEAARKEREQRYAIEAQARHVRDLAKEEALKKQNLQLRLSREADNVQKLEKLLELGGKSYTVFTWEEMESATSSFSEALKIGSGAFGTVYKGKVHHKTVAIKVLKSDDSHIAKHFEKELEILGKTRHRHLLLLLGACLDRACLVYEYMENGSLEDRLQCKGDTAPLPWYHRFRIAWEITLALIFLHSSKPKPIIHRDLKPANILLDRNFTSKIGDAGLATFLPLRDTSSTHTIRKSTDLVGTLFYLDPEYQRTGQVSAKSDVYALGMVFLQLLTAKSPIGLADTAERAMEEDHLIDILDQRAGNWPVREAHELTQLGLRCLEMRSKDRPDLKSKVLVVLERLNNLASTVYHSVQPIPTAPPSHFICPILKRVMQDPCIASDGYSYERVAIEMWLNENDVSPLTKARLPDKNLVPNLALICLINSWKGEVGATGPIR